MNLSFIFLDAWTLRKCAVHVSHGHIVIENVSILGFYVRFFKKSDEKISQNNRMLDEEYELHFGARTNLDSWQAY